MHVFKINVSATEFFQKYVALACLYTCSFFSLSIHVGSHHTVYKYIIKRGKCSILLPPHFCLCQFLKLDGFQLEVDREFPYKYMCSLQAFLNLHLNDPNTQKHKLCSGLILLFCCPRLMGIIHNNQF